MNRSYLFENDKIYKRHHLYTGYLNKRFQTLEKRLSSMYEKKIAIEYQNKEYDYRVMVDGKTVFDLCIDDVVDKTWKDVEAFVYDLFRNLDMED